MESVLLLTELELCSVTIDSINAVTSLVAVLSCATRLKQLNLLGLSVSIAADNEALQQWQWQKQSNHLLLDPILSTVSKLADFDECRLSCGTPSSNPLISASCLHQVLSHKPKWWRLALDGLGLDDQHCHVLTQALCQESCRFGDLLSLTMNPAVSRIGWNQLFDALAHKQRLGLVKVDDKSWQATFDLVRSMNNIHGRLQFLEVGRGGGGGEKGGTTTTYASRERWIEWLAKLSQISWEDDAHKINYLWYTLLEQPDYIHC